MLFRPAKPDDVDGMMLIIDQAKAYLKRSGIDQWQSGYPDKATLAEDIRIGNAYILEDNSAVVGTVAVDFTGEPSYAGMTGGRWLSNGDYAVVHRMALHDAHKGKGLSGFFMDEIENLCRSRNVFSIKADTHPGNRVMQGIFDKRGYARCGVIIFEGSKKFAYEKILPKVLPCPKRPS